MTQTQAKAPLLAQTISRLLLRALTIAAVAVTLGWVVQRSSALLDRDASPAGFARGMLHGAIMPMAMPNLIIGQDVTLYAPNNTGRLYKLGYTAGVNACGLLFFGYFFWRVNRTRRDLQAAT
jgi:ABC-type spermidine/putrescine transport system permease subunit II